MVGQFDRFVDVRAICSSRHSCCAVSRPRSCIFDCICSNRQHIPTFGILGVLIGQSLITNYPLALFANARQVLPDDVINVSSKGNNQSPPGTEKRVVPRKWNETVRYAMSIEAQPILSFFLIGHCVFSWMFALLAAGLPAGMYARQHSTPDSPC